MRIALSFPPLPTFWPSGLQSTANTSSRWPGRSIESFPVRTFHTFNVVSLDDDTNRRESAEKQHWYTAPTWPRRVVMNLYSLASRGG